MGFRDWVNRLLGVEGKAEDSAIISDVVEIAGLDFRTAIDAHMKWKKRLEEYIGGTSTETLRVEIVSRDDQCVLGKWIHGEGGHRYERLDLFKELREVHASFHSCAGCVITEVDQGNAEKAAEMLNHGDYAKVSARVKMLLARLYVQTADKAA